MKQFRLSDRKLTTLFLTFVFGLLLFAISGCDALDSFDTILGLPFQQSPGSATATPIVEVEEVDPLPEDTVVETAVPEETGEELFQLILWVPVFMDPSGESASASIFRQHLEEFENGHEGVVIDVRVKSQEGPASLMTSLTSTSAAAPLSMPSLIMLSRTDLETAAKKGLILPVADYSVVINDLDWFQYARSMAIIGDSAYGLPFAGDTLVMLSRSTAYPNGLSKSWTEQNQTAKPVYFEANDLDANLLLAYYLSLGGSLYGEEESLILEADVLEEVLQVFQNGLAANTISADYFNLDVAALMAAYNEGTTDTVITWSSNYLKSNMADTVLHPILSLTGYDYTVADGWILALADPLPERRTLAVELAEHLVDVNFLAEWNEAAGYLPMRSSSLQTWENADLVKTLSLISHSAHSYPDREIMDVIAPVLVQALNQVLVQGIDAPTAAQNAVLTIDGLKE